MIINRTGGENLATDVDITSPDRPVCIQVTCKVSSEMTKMIKVCLFTAI